MVIFAPFVCASNLFAQEKEKQIEEFLDQSGLLIQIEEIPTVIMMQFEEEKDPFDPESQAIIKSRLKEAFEFDKLLNDARFYISETFDADRMQVVLNWLNDPATQAINEQEIEASRTENEEDREAYFTLIETQPPPQERIELVFAFEEITDASYNTVSIITNMYMALVRAMNPFTDPDQYILPENMEQVQRAIFTQLMPVYERINILMNLYTYKSIDQDSLEKYIDFYTTADGQWFVYISYGTMDYVLRKANERILLMADEG